MQSNARCWLPPATAPLIAMLWLSACAMAGSDTRPNVCPPVVHYNRETQDRAALEVEGLPDGAALTGMLSDYSVMRDQARRCLSQ